MRALRPATLLPRLGLAGAGLLATAIVFAAAGGLVAFGLWPEPAPQGDEQQLVLPATRAQSLSASQPLRRARATSTAQTPRTAQLAGVAGDVAGSSPAIVMPAAAEPITPDPHVPVRPGPSEPAPFLVDPAGPLEPVGETVSDTTTALASTLRSIADALAHGLGRVSPGATPALTQAGSALAATVDETGRAVGDLLGSPAR